MFKSSLSLDRLFMGPLPRVRCLPRSCPSIDGDNHQHLHQRQQQQQHMKSSPRLEAKVPQHHEAPARPDYKPGLLRAQGNDGQEPQLRMSSKRPRLLRQGQRRRKEGRAPSGSNAVLEQTRTNMQCRARVPPIALTNDVCVSWSYISRMHARPHT